MEWKTTESTEINPPEKDNLDWVLTRLGKAEAENIQYYATYKEAEASCRRWKFATALVALAFLAIEAVVWWWL